MRIPLTVLVLLCLTVAQAQPKMVDKVIAVVGKSIVLKSDIEAQYQQYAAQGGDVPADLKCQILNQQLLQNMLLTQAEVDSIEVSEDEVEGELDRRIRYFISLTGGQEQLEEYYQKSVLEIKEEFREEIRDQILAQRMQAQIMGDVTVTPAEVKTFFNSIPKDSLPYFNAEVEVGQIVMFPKPSNEARAAARERLLDIKRRVGEGEDFGTLAILYSDDPGSASNKGELPEFTRNDGYVPAFVGAAFRLKEPGEISDVVETEFGYHLIQLMARKGERVKVRHILVIPKIGSADMQATKARMDSVRQAIVNGEMTFTAAASRFSEDPFTERSGGFIVNNQTGENFWELDDLGAFDPDLPFIINNLDEGEISTPREYVNQQQKQGYRIVYLQTETEPHVANMQDDYARIQAMALAQKKDNLMHEWLSDKLSETYVKIDNAYNHCEQLRFWSSTNY